MLIPPCAVSKPAVPRISPPDRACPDTASFFSFVSVYDLQIRVFPVDSPPHKQPTSMVANHSCRFSPFCFRGFTAMRRGVVGPRVTLKTRSETPEAPWALL